MNHYMKKFKKFNIIQNNNITCFRFWENFIIYTQYISNNKVIIYITIGINLSNKQLPSSHHFTFNCFYIYIFTNCFF